MSRLLHQSPFHDCEIRCLNTDTSFPGHKSILCSRNRYFSAALTGNFEEASTNAVTLDEIPFAVEGLLIYLYTLHYPNMDWIQIAARPTSVWEFHFEIFKIADKRQAPELHRMAKDELVDLVHNKWDEEFVVKMIPVLWSIRGSIADHLRNEILQKAVEHHDSFVNRQDYGAMVVKNPEFAKDLVSEFSKIATEREEQLEELTEKVGVLESRVNDMTQSLKASAAALKVANEKILLAKQSRYEPLGGR